MTLKPCKGCGRYVTNIGGARIGYCQRCEPKESLYARSPGTIYMSPDMFEHLSKTLKLEKPVGDQE